MQTSGRCSTDLTVESPLWADIVCFSPSECELTQEHGLPFIESGALLRSSADKSQSQINATVVGELDLWFLTYGLIPNC